LTAGSYATIYAPAGGTLIDFDVSWISVVGESNHVPRIQEIVHDFIAVLRRRIERVRRPGTATEPRL
jgi:hypothetical protein